MLTALLFAAAAAPARAAEDPAVPQAARECPAVDPVPAAFSAGMRAAVDRESGELRAPTNEEARRLSEAGAAAMPSAAGELEMVQHPDGTISVDLKGAFMQDIVVRKKPDGSLSFDCVPRDRKVRVLEEK